MLTSFQPDTTSRLLFAALVLFFPGMAICATWDGEAGNGLWSDPINWLGDVLPGPTTQVRIEDAAAEVHVDVDVTVGPLYLDGAVDTSPTLIVDSGVTLTLSGSQNVWSGWSVISNQGTIQQGGRVVAGVSSSVTNNGIWTVTANELSSSSILPFVNNGTLTISGDATLKVWRSVVNHGKVELIGGTDASPEMSFVNNGEFHNTFDGFVIGIGPEKPRINLGSSSSFGHSPGTFRNDGTVTLDGSFLVYDDSTLINTGTFDNSGGNTTTLGAMILDDTGTLLPGVLAERQKHWTGNGDATSWSDPANWSPFPVVPNSDTQGVYIEAVPSSSSIRVNIDAHVRWFNVNPSPGTLDLTIDAGVNFAIGTFNVTSFLGDGTNLTNYGTLSIDRVFSMSADASLDNQGTLTITDVFGSSGELNNSGNLTITSTGSITNNGNFINTGLVTNENAMTNMFEGSFDNFGTLDNVAGTFENNGTFVTECDSSLLGTISGIPPIIVTCDITPPVITLPGNISTEATNPFGAMVSYTANANDDIDGAIAPICNPPSGSAFPLGITEVTCAATDAAGNSASASFTVTVINVPPIANADSAVTIEDESVVVNVLVNDTDPNGDALIVMSTTEPSNGTVIIDNNNITYFPKPNFFGEDSFNYDASDSHGDIGTATVTITVTPVNDPPTVRVDTTDQTVQYSDAISVVTISADDIDSTNLTLISSGLPASAVVGLQSCTTSGEGMSCSWSLTGFISERLGSFTPTFDISDGVDQTSTSTTIEVLREDAVFTFGNANPIAVGVDSPGSDGSVQFTLTVEIQESTNDNSSSGSSAAGDIGLADVQMTLLPVGPGASVATTGCTSYKDGNGYSAVKNVTCTFRDAPVNTYSVDVRTTDDYYLASTEDVLTVFDPSLGFTTGGGWFEWPGTGDKTNFGYTMKYSKNGSKVQGSLLMIRHLPDGTKYRVKSNALEGMSLGEDTSMPYGWASFSGKSTYLEPGWMEPMGNHSFTVYVEDRDEPGSGIDRLWIENRDREGLIKSALSLPKPAGDNSEPIHGGNIVAPHSSGDGNGS